MGENSHEKDNFAQTFGFPTDRNGIPLFLEESVDNGEEREISRASSVIEEEDRPLLCVGEINGEEGFHTLDGMGKYNVFGKFDKNENSAFRFLS